MRVVVAHGKGGALKITHWAPCRRRGFDGPSGQRFVDLVLQSDREARAELS